VPGPGIDPMTSLMATRLTNHYATLPHLLSTYLVNKVQHYMKDQQPVVFRLRLIPWPNSTFSLLPAPQMEVAALPGLARGIVSNRGSSGRVWRMGDFPMSSVRRVGVDDVTATTHLFGKGRAEVRLLLTAVLALLNAQPSSARSQPLGDGQHCKNPLCFGRVDPSGRTDKDGSSVLHAMQKSPLSPFSR